MNIKTFGKEFLAFGLKQASACIFGAYLLALMIGTKYWYPFSSVYRYDFLFISAIVFQFILLYFKLESFKEGGVIITFHLVALAMELFKTADSIGSWRYPEQCIFVLGNVPLFAGFMYSAVGSFIARVWRLSDFQFTRYPDKRTSIILVVLIYINFFTHHFIMDFRWVLLAVTVVLFGRTTIYYRNLKVHRRMPLLLGWFLVATFIWIAENIATYTRIWIYPNQTYQWEMVSLSKLNSWFLLMLLSFVLVSLINDIKEYSPEGND